MYTPQLGCCLYRILLQYLGTRPGLPMRPLVLCRTPREICQSLINPRNRGRILYINPEPMALLCLPSRRSCINRVWMVCGKLRGLRPCDNSSKRKQEIDSFVYFPEVTSCSATGRICRIWNLTISYEVVQISYILLGVSKIKFHGSDPKLSSRKREGSS